MRAARATGIVALAVGVAAAGLLVAWLALSPPTAGDPMPEGETEGRAAETADLPLLAGRSAGETTVTAHAARATVRGTVRRAGVPAAAAVEIRPLGLPGARLGGRDGLRPDVFVSIASRDQAPAAAATAGEDGRFTVTGLGPGAYEARAVAADGTEGFSAFEVRQGDLATVAVELPGGPESIGGRAVHVDGRPFSGWVAAIPYQEHHDDDHADLTGGTVAPTDAEGRFLLRGLRPGPYILSLLVPGRLRNVLTVIQAPAPREVLLLADSGLAEVAGSVVDADDGRAVPFAQVAAVAEDVPGWFVHVVTTADGEGRFRVLTSDRSFRLLVEAPGFARVIRSFTRPVSEVTVRLPRPARVEGRVVAEGDGRGVEGAVVWLVAHDLGRLRTVSGADGAFAFPAAPVTDEADLYVLGGGWASRGIEALFEESLHPFHLELGPAARVVVDLPVGPSARLEGRVLAADGAPVAAEVACELVEDVPYAATRADTEGRFAFADLPPGVEVGLAARDPEHSPARQKVRLSSSGPTTTELRMPPARWLHVLVTAADKPVPGARVTWYLVSPDSEESDDDGDAQRDVPLTDDQGEARIGPLPEGRINISVTRRGFVASPVVAATGPLGGDLRAEVSLEEGYVVEGLVTVPEGVSPEGAIVGISAGEGWWNVQAGPGGEFRFEGVPADSAWVSASLSTRRGEIRGELELEVTGDVRDARIVLQPDPAEEFTWEIRLLDPEGRRVAAGSVTLYATEEGGSFRHVARSRVADGSARLEVDEERWREPLWVVPANARDEYGRPLDGAPTPAGPFLPVDGPVEVRMEPGRRISGRVLGPDGRAAASALVKARSDGPARGLRGPSFGGEVTARADPEGRFVLHGLAEAEHWVWVGTPEGYVEDPPQRVAAGSEGVTLRLRRALTVAVTVLDPAGQPVRGATVWWRRPNAPQGVNEAFDVATDRSGVGRYRRFDPEARYLVFVEPPDSREDLGERGDLPGRAEDMTVTLPRALSIRGVVLRPDDRPAGSVPLWWTKDPREGWSGNAWSDEDGTFVLHRMSPGRHYLCATPQAPPGAQAPGLAVEAGDTNVVLRLHVPPESEAAGEGD